MEKLNRKQAVDMCGEETVAQVDRERCDFTNRLMPDNSGSVELAAYVTLDDGSHLAAYYYQDEDEINECEDMGRLDWVIDHYAIV
jgi:hypothetical protein